MSSDTGQNRKFYNLSVKERLARLQKETGLSDMEAAALSGERGLSVEDADHMIENVVGTFSLPIGIARHFIINGRTVPVPMAVEEPSIVAGASFMAKLAQPTGGFIAEASAPEMIGQIQVLDLDDPADVREKLLSQKQALLDEAAKVDPVLMRLGGGPKDLVIRLIPESPIGSFLVVHLIYDVRDAMGANAVNTAVERLAPRVEAITGGRVLLRILSNLADRRLTKAAVTLRTEDFGI